MFRGRLSVNVWWTMKMPSSPLGVQTGHGPSRQWKTKRMGNQVWDKMASRWAGKDDWMEARKKKHTPEDKYKFVTFVLSK